MERWWLTLVLALVVSACSVAPPKAPTPAAPRPVCNSALVSGKPALCIPKSGSGLYVVGLPKGHGWDRGDWLMLELPVPGVDRSIAAAMISVVHVYPDLVEVHLLYQAVTKSLDGAAARRVDKDSRARLGKFVGRITQVDLARVRVDVGVQDRAAVGDVYQVLSERDRAPIARLKITEVGEFSAWARPIGKDPREHIRPGLDAIFLKDASEGLEGAEILILLVNFDPHDAGDADEAKAGRGFAKDLADTLAKSAEETHTKVRYDGKERVDLGGGEARGHDEARRVGVRFGADIVVWGSMRCGERGCAQPFFTVVDAQRLRERSYAGVEMWIDRDEAGFKFRGEAPANPIALAAAILGSVAYDAQRYADAKHYLELAVSKSVLQGDDELRGRLHLANAMFVLGQTAAARQQAGTTIERARRAGENEWEQWGEDILARVDAQEGKPNEARARFEAIRRWAAGEKDQRLLVHSLHEMAMLEMQQGRVDEARKLYQESLGLSRSIGAVQKEAAALHSLAILEAQQGRVDEARKLYQESLGLSRSIGDVRGEAATLHQLAILEAQQGRVREARKLYEQSLELKRRIGYVQGEAATLHQLASLEAQQGRVDEARKLYEQSLELKRRIGYVQGEAATLHQLASLEAQQGRMDEARRLYQQSLELKRRIGDVQGEAATLHQLASLEAQQGRVDEARRLYQQSLELKRRIGYVQGEAATLHQLAILETQQGRVDEARNFYHQSLEREATASGGVT